MSNRDNLRLAGVVHDLNNVLQTFLDAADQLADDPRWQGLSAALIRNVERGKLITRALGQAPGRGKVPEATPLDTILNSAIAFVEDSQAVRHMGNGLADRPLPSIRFVRDLDLSIELYGRNPDGQPNPQSEGWAWERVFINLFLNSIRAMPEGGTIEIVARRIAGSENRAGHIEIAVRDQGTGIPAGVGAKLFEPHVSTHASSGLGLHIVRTIVQEDGGAIQCSNRKDGPGAEFVISLPMKSSTVKARGAGRTQTASAG